MSKIKTGAFYDMRVYNAFLSIGSNKGNKIDNLNRAIQYLNLCSEIRVTAQSSLYLTRPRDYEDQEWFVNGVLKIETRFQEPFSLLTALKKIEKMIDSYGKPFRFGPRKIDLDIIYFSDLLFKTEDIEIPHPRMHERCFVLKPICEIAPEIIHPVFKKSNRELLQLIEYQKGQDVILLSATGKEGYIS